MKFTINVEFFKFYQKEYIQKGQRGKNKWLHGMYDGIGYKVNEGRFKNSNEYECRIRINTLSKSSKCSANEEKN